MNELERQEDSPGDVAPVSAAGAVTAIEELSRLAEKLEENDDIKEQPFKDTCATVSLPQCRGCLSLISC